MTEIGIPGNVIVVCRILTTGEEIQRMGRLRKLNTGLDNYIQQVPCRISREELHLTWLLAILSGRRAQYCVQVGLSQSSLKFSSYFI